MKRAIDYQSEKDIYKVLQLESPKDTLVEVQSVLANISPKINIASVTYAFLTTINLFQGRYKGYLACNTNYHDLYHTIDTFLATVRLIDGAVLAGERFDSHDIGIALKAALFHDSGYIQENDDQEGTGAKYTANHVYRSMEFFEKHKAKLGLSDQDSLAGQSMILCTQLNQDVKAIPFSSYPIEYLGRILGVADLLAQTADRIYLEKLLLLYHEFKEGNFGNYKDEKDLLRKTIHFFDLVANRTDNMLEKNDIYLRLHFLSRWNINDNLYLVSINKQKRYLEKILEDPSANLFDYLKRGGIANEVSIKQKVRKRSFKEN